MGLSVTELHLRNFRSYESFEFAPDPQLTVIVGPNAVGKTNVIEALQLLTSAESFRHPQWAETVRWGEEESLVSLKAEGDGRHLEVDLGVGASGKREYRVNGKLRRRISDVTGFIPCVLFTPEDLRLVKDSADKRRAALDSLGVQLSPAYRSLKSEYERLIRQRNSQLRAPSMDAGVLDALTEQCIHVGASLMAARVRLFSRVNARMSEFYESLSSEETLSARYLPSWTGDEGEPGGVEEFNDRLRQVARERKDEELARGVTLFGPHRDDVAFKVNGRGARAFSSQGQQRTITLSWKLAEVFVVKEISGQAPLLLLDDVMSELDEARRHSLASLVGDAAQTVITTTNIGYFDEALIDRAKVISLS